MPRLSNVGAIKENANANAIANENENENEKGGQFKKQRHFNKYYPYVPPRTKLLPSKCHVPRPGSCVPCAPSNVASEL